MTFKLAPSLFPLEHQSYWMRMYSGDLALTCSVLYKPIQSSASSAPRVKDVCIYSVETTPLACLSLWSHLSGWHGAHTCCCCPLNTQHTCSVYLLDSGRPVLADLCGWPCAGVPSEDQQYEMADRVGKHNRCGICWSRAESVNKSQRAVFI